MAAGRYRHVQPPVFLRASAHGSEAQSTGILSRRSACEAEATAPRLASRRGVCACPRAHLVRCMESDRGCVRDRNALKHYGQSPFDLIQASRFADRSTSSASRFDARAIASHRDCSEGALLVFAAKKHAAALDRYSWADDWNACVKDNERVSFCLPEYKPSRGTRPVSYRSAHVRPCVATSQDSARCGLRWTWSGRAR